MAFEYKPAPQEVQLDRPELVAYLPASQLVQAEALSELIYPAGHVEHRRDPLPIAYLPGKQAPQDATPEDAETFPASHKKQLPWPGAPWYWPEGQGAQLETAELEAYLPVPQAEQLGEPASLEYWPATQVVHDEAASELVEPA